MSPALIPSSSHQREFVYMAIHASPKSQTSSKFIYSYSKIYAICAKKAMCKKCSQVCYLGECCAMHLQNKPNEVQKDGKQVA